jgi:hypothetical protein
MPYNDNGIMTFTAAGTIAAKRRVKFSGTAADPKVAHSGATGVDCGVSLFAAATGELVSVALLTKPGTFDVDLGAATAPAYGATLYPAAAGKLTNSASTALAIATYTAIRKAAATGEVLEVMFKKFHSTATAY